MQERKGIMMTTGTDFDGYRVARYIQILNKELIFKNSFLNTLSANLSDLADMFSFKAKEMSGSTALVEQGKNYVMEQFEREAIRVGANAVLGIDFEMSLGTDVVKISVSGTAVIIEPEQQDAEKHEGVVLELPVMNYSLEEQMRICYCLLEHDRKNKVINIAVEGFLPTGTLPEAIKVDIELLTIWDESIKLNPISFIDLTIENGIYISEKHCITIPEEKLHEICAARCVIMAKKADDKIAFCKAHYCNSTETSKTVSYMKKIYHITAVQAPESTDSGYICSCGTLYGEQTEECPYCNRAFHQLEKGLEEYALLDKVEECDSAREILEYIESVSSSEELLGKLKRIAANERVYGNSKEDAIITIKNWMDENL